MVNKKNTLPAGYKRRKGVNLNNGDDEKIDLQAIARELFPDHKPPAKYLPRENKTYNMTNKLVRITESDLHRIVKQSVNKVLNEDDMTQQGALLGNRSTLQPKDVNFGNYQPTDRIGMIMSSLSQLWKMDKEYTLEIINRALGTNFSI